MRRPFNSTAYRYPNEQLILFFTLLLVFVVIAITATATVCLSGVFIIMAVGMSYYASQAHHQALMQGAQQITSQTSPELWQLAEQARQRLQAEPVDIFVANNRGLNAYTFGIASPKVIVLHAELFRVMDRSELQFIIGHELGHVRLGHTWVNSLVGGLAGIPSSASAAALLELAFRSWNRACEYSCDRAGLLATGNPSKAISAMIKLEAGSSGLSAAGLEAALRRIDAEDDTLAGSLNELFATHPMLIRRINQIRTYAAGAQYAQLQPLMQANQV